MTVNQFNTLRNHKQLRHLIIQGACIGERKTMDGQVLLFQSGQWYTEVFFTLDCEAITNSRTFDDIDELLPYLEHVNLSGVL